MNFLKKIGGFFVRAKDVVAKALVEVFGKDAAGKILDATEAVLKTEVGKIALAVVAELVNAQGMDSKAKAEAAFSRVGEQVKQSGIDAKDHMIKFAIEMAVLALKNGVAKLQ
jgi:hypothetical protein